MDLLDEIHTFHLPLKFFIFDRTWNHRNLKRLCYCQEMLLCNLDSNFQKINYWFKRIVVITTRDQELFGLLNAKPQNIELHTKLSCRSLNLCNRSIPNIESCKTINLFAQKNILMIHMFPSQFQLMKKWHKSQRRDFPLNDSLSPHKGGRQGYIIQILKNKRIRLNPKPLKGFIQTLCGFK